MTELLAIIQTIDVKTLISIMQALGIFWPAVKISAGVLLYLWVFLVLIIAALSIYGKKLRGELNLTAAPKSVSYVMYSIVGVAIVFDFIVQYTIFTVYCWDLPRKGEYLVTSRFRRYIDHADGSRNYGIAISICTGYLDVFDPTGDHCHRLS